MECGEQISSWLRETVMIFVGHSIYFFKISLKACAQRFRYALFAFIHRQTYFEYYTLTLRLASLVKKAVIYAYWTKELFDICRKCLIYGDATLGC